MATGGAQAAGVVNKLTCAVCLEKFRRPKLLPCFHTFCQGCLQAVAGSSPSFPCPACRAPVLLPPGGVGALQGNFYIQQDLNKDSTPAVRLCDVCAEDREATHTCMQCQQRYCLPCRRVHDSITSSRFHTVVALQGQNEENLKGDKTTKAEKEEMCPKHRNQPVILHCTACTANICIQCKLTSHEGHATEDLADTGAKVKVKLQNMLEKMALQRRDLEGLLSVIEKKQDQIKTLHQMTEDGIKARVEKAHQLLTQCRDNTLDSLQSLNRDVLGKLSAKGERLQQKNAALTAQSDHVTRVLGEDRDADIVSLEAQLKEVTVDDLEVQQLLKELDNESEPYTCEYNSAALKPFHLQEYVGQLKKSTPKISTAQPSSDGTTLTAVAPSALPGASLPPSNHVVKVSEVFYSRNRKSTVVAMCKTTEKRVWIKYSPSGGGEMMGLFDKDRLLKQLDDILPGSCFLTIVEDGTACSYSRKCSLLKPNGKITSVTGSNLKSFFGASKCSTGNCVFLSTSTDGHCTNTLCRCRITSYDPLTFEYDEVLRTSEVLLDVSTSQKYFVLLGQTSTSFRLLFMSDSKDLRRICSFTPGQDRRILDACFFPVDGQEMLVVVVKGDNKLHVLDHTDGCRFVRYLDTGPVDLDRPRLLATDQQTVLWIGCDGGKAVMLEL